MRVFALDTATERLSLAIVDGQRQYVREIDAGQAHSALTEPALRDIFAAARLRIADIDAFVFGQGPGSFTGVRIACGFMQGMALGAGRPLIGVSTLLSYAEQAQSDRVLVAQDARMGEFYVCMLVRDESTPSGWRAIVEPMLATVESLPELPGNDWHGVGSAFAVASLSDILRSRYPTQLARVTPGLMPRAADLACIALRQGLPTAVAGEPALPHYLRNHVALTLAERRAKQSAQANA